MCTGSPARTGADESTHDSCGGTHVVADHSEQGWRRLCDGVIVFDDGGYLTPDGRTLRHWRRPASA